MQNFLLRYKYFFLLVLVACTGFWQVAFFQNTLKWDAIDQYYPWRMFVIECLRSGTLPLWNPYEQLGYPIHADPQSGAWYPVVWLLSLFGNYTLYTLQVEFMMHIIFAGVGMMLLAQIFELKKPAAFLIACAYMLSGFFVGNAQHITFIVAGCWLPFVFYSYKKMIEECTLKYAVLFAFFCFLLLSGGYPAYGIIAFYIMLCVSVFFTLRFIKTKNFTALKKFIAVHLFASTFVLLLSGVVLVSVFLSSKYLLRTSGLTYSIASHGPFSPQALISILLPLAAVKNPVLMQTDISMSSIYMGLVVFASLLIAAFSKKNLTEKLIWAGSLICLLAAFGDYTPVRKWLYDFFPFMDLFRFPAVFRVFVIIGFLLLAGFAFNKDEILSHLKQPILFLVFISVSIVIFFLINNSIAYSFSTIETLSFKQSIFFQAIVQSFFLLLLFFIIKSTQPAKKKLALVLTISTLDIICAAQINVPVNVIYQDKTKQAAKIISKKYSHDFVTPVLQPSRLNSDSLKAPKPLWRNKNIFTKQPAWDGYNSFLLNNYLKFTDHVALRNLIIKNNWAYFANSIFPYTDSIKTENITAESNFVAFVNISDINATNNLSSDTNNSVSVINYLPHHITLRTQTRSNKLLVLMQQYFPGWEIFIDGKNSPIIISNYLFMSAVVSNGEHTIEFVYKNKNVKTAFYISALCFIAAVVFIPATFLLKKKN